MMPAQPRPGDRLVQILRYIDEDRKRLEDSARAGYEQARRVLAGDPTKVAMMRDYFTTMFPGQSTWIDDVMKRIQGGDQ
jgi:hypothetical protein